MEYYEKVLGRIVTSDCEIEVTQTIYQDGTLAVVGSSYEPDVKYWEPWGAFSVNLSGYGMVPVENGLFINHDIYGTEAFDKFYDEFCDKNFGKIPVEFGYAKSVMVKLK